MKTTKVYQALMALSKAEVRAFRRFMKSPYFNSNQALVELAESLIELTKKEENREKDYFWSIINKNKDYDDTRFRKYCSDLIKLIERFLAQTAYDNDPIKNSVYLLKTVSSRGIKGMYNSTLKTAHRLTQNQKFKGIDFLHDLYEIERYHQLILAADDRTQRLNIEKISTNLDEFYLAQKLMLFQVSMSQKRVVDREYNLLFIDEIFNHIEQQTYTETPQIRILHLIGRIYRSNSQEYFPELKEQLFKNVNLFPAAEANTIFRAGLNFLIGWLNEGDNKTLEQLFEMYNFALNQEFFFMEEGFNPWIFKSIVIVALRLEEFDWCTNFIDDFANRLDEGQRENAIVFNKARLHWYQKNHEQVISLLNQVEFDDFSYNLSSKAMLLATYYELEEVEALFSFLDSFKAFLRRNTAKIPEKRRENYLNLIKYTKRLSKLTRRDHDKLNAMKDEIENKASLGDKRWILEKIKEKTN